MRRVPSEIRNLANIAKYAARSLAGGAFADARAAGKAIGFRALEAVQDLAGPPRVTCEFCGWTGRRFKTFVVGASCRRDALCPRCLSLERHREFIVLFRRVRPLYGERVRVLDIAPTLAFSTLCAADPDIDYVSLDRESRLAMIRGDLQRLPFRTGAFDFALCSHVLDYVPDDVLAMREIRRVLNDGGLAILEQIFHTDRPTEEWGGPRPEKLDRIRQYGRDYLDRLSQAGFHLRPAGMGTQQVFLAFKDEGNPLIETVATAVAR